MYQPALNQLRSNRRQHRDDKRPRSQYQPRIDRAIAIERLQHLRNQRSAAEQAETENEKQDAGDSEVSVGEQPEIDHRLMHAHFPNDGRDPANKGQPQHPTDKGAAEPILNLPAVQGHFERG